jgi:DNA repair protein SbcD/Mre11
VAIEPFRFLHTGDLHLDSPFLGLTDAAPAPIAEALRRSTVAAWERVVGLALDEHVDFVLVAGDAFEHATRTLLGQVRFRDGLQRLAEADIPSLVVTGNHDPLSGWEPSVRWPPLAFRYGANEVEARPVLRDGREIARVHGISYAVRDVRDNLAARFRRAGDEPFAIGLLHANVGGQPGHALYAPCSLADLRASGMDYWALGHVHRPSILSAADPVAVYCGNPQGRDPGETDARGCYVVGVDATGRATPTFHATDVVRWQRLEVSIDSLESEDSLLDRLVERVDAAWRAAGRSIVARIVLVGRGPLHASLRRQPTLTSDLRTLAAERLPADADAFAWIESLRDATRPAFPLDAPALHGTFLGELIAEADRGRSALASTGPLDDATEDELEAAGWEALLDELYAHARIRRLLREPGRLARPDRARLAELLTDAETTVLDRLADG